MLADYDHDKAQQVIHWPVREALEAYMGKARREAEDEWRTACIVAVIQKGFRFRGVKIPPRPEILEESDGTARRSSTPKR